MADRRWIHTAYAQRVHFGAGSAGRLAAVVKESGARRVMLVTTEGRLESEDGEKLRARLGRTLASVFSGVRSHVPTTAVQSAVNQAQAEAVDGLVSFGGGSCADTGKAVGFFMEQQAGAPGMSYLDRSLVPHVAVPTTYSGAELTPFFGMTDTATRRKAGAGGPTTAPVAALYDPELTITTPPRVSAETGMNALAHAIECAYSPNRTPEAEAIALSAVARIASWLPEVVDDPTDLGSRSEMMVGSALAARCLANATVGVHHGLAQLLGGRTGLSHGLANALILPHAVRFNAEGAGSEMSRIGEALGDPDDPAGACGRLRERLGLPDGLASCGVTEEDLEAVARLSQGSPAVASNRRPVSEDDARAILDAAW